MLSDGDRAIGIVPAFLFDVPLALVAPPPLDRLLGAIDRGPLARLARQRTFFVGNVAGEEGCVGLVEGRALGEVAAFVHAEARKRATAQGAAMLVWKDFEDADAHAIAKAAGPRAFAIASYPGTAIDLVPGGYAAFLAGLGSKRRRRNAKKLREGEAALPLRPRHLVRPGEPELAAMFALFRQTRARATTAFEELTPEFFRTIALEPEASFVVLEDPGGTIRAFMLLLDLGSRIVNQFVGLDYDGGPRAYLHFRLFAAAYDHACGEGARVLQSGQTGYFGKLDLGHRLVPLWNVAEHRYGLVNAAMRAASRGVSWSNLDPQLAEYLRAHPEADPGRGGKFADSYRT